MKNNIEIATRNVWCYLRVSTDAQDTESQRVGIEEWLKANGCARPHWVSDEGVSGAVAPSKRKLGGILKSAKAGDIIVFSEISRIGRKLDLILDFIREAYQRGLRVYTVKDGYRLEDTMQSKVLLTVMGLAAEIERDLLRQRTREGLQRAVAAGKRLGRPKGRRNSRHKLDGRASLIRRMVAEGAKVYAIAQKCKVHPNTARKWLEENGYEVK